MGVQALSADGACEQSDQLRLPRAKSLHRSGAGLRPPDRCQNADRDRFGRANVGWKGATAQPVGKNPWLRRRSSATLLQPERAGPKLPPCRAKPLPNSGGRRLVEIHRELMSAATAQIMASKDVSVLSARMAMRLNFLSLQRRSR